MSEDHGDRYTNQPRAGGHLSKPGMVNRFAAFIADKVKLELSLGVLPIVVTPICDVPVVVEVQFLQRWWYCKVRSSLRSLYIACGRRDLDKLFTSHVQVFAS